MRQTDIAIVGGGLAGSTAAAMLGRAGIDALVVDPHTVYPPEFRCEKLDGSQVRLLRETGLAAAVLQAATPDEEVWIARRGHLVDRRRNNQYNILYDGLVNTVRSEIPKHTAFIHAKATGISTGRDLQTITLSNGDEICARLVVLANGLNIGLRRTLGMEREIVSTCHSISIGFRRETNWPFQLRLPGIDLLSGADERRDGVHDAVPHRLDDARQLFVYRDMQDPWLREVRRRRKKRSAPDAGVDEIDRRFRSRGRRQNPAGRSVCDHGLPAAGIVLVGDAFATSCPAAGTGANKVFTDVARLCNVHIPGWLATSGMAEEKISFYDDAVKIAMDEHSAAKANFLRSLSTDAGLAWSARRWIRFFGQFGVGVIRPARERLSVGSPLGPEWRLAAGPPRKRSHDTVFFTRPRDATGPASEVRDTSQQSPTRTSEQRGTSKSTDSSAAFRFGS